MLTAYPSTLTGNAHTRIMQELPEYIRTRKRFATEFQFHTFVDDLVLLKDRVFNSLAVAAVGFLSLGVSRRGT